MTGITLICPHAPLHKVDGSFHCECFGRDCAMEDGVVRLLNDPMMMEPC